MSIKILSWVWENSPYEGSALLLHLALADYSNDAGECWPSQTSLASKARCSDRYVRTVLGRMVDDGMVKVIHHGNGKSSNRYRLIARNTVPPRNAVPDTPEDSSGETGTTVPTNHHEPSITKCAYCAQNLASGRPHDCPAMNMRIR